MQAREDSSLMGGLADGLGLVAEVLVEEVVVLLLLLLFVVPLQHHHQSHGEG